jgi:TrpR-related protein YerC/YecD
MNSKIRDRETDKLFEGILQLKTVDECYAFFQDICTVSEIKAMAQRLQVAIMLYKNYKYSEITEKTGASPATISRVSRNLNYGADGYMIVLQRLSNLE